MELHDCSTYPTNWIGYFCAVPNLTNAELYDADLRNANLQKASLVQANMVKSVLYGANLLGANLSKANLRMAELESRELLTASDLSQATMPDGRKYEEWVAAGDIAAALASPSESTPAAAPDTAARLDHAPAPDDTDTAATDEAVASSNQE